MNTAAIIQARTGSTRLPSKTLETIGNKTILEWVIHRTRMIPSLHKQGIIIATTRQHEDKPILHIARKTGVTAYRGPTHDVLTRYHDIATKLRPTIILRITADCPLLDPQLADNLIRALREHTSAEYAAYTDAPTGLTQEAFTIELLRTTHQYARTPHDREHVVPWMLRRPQTSRPILLEAPAELAEHKHLNYSIDTPTDLRRLRRLYDRSDGQLFDLSALEIIQLNQKAAAA